MPHTFGGLQLPVPVPENARTEATSDPFLDTVVAYLKAVINAQTGDAWRAIAPGTANPVIATGTHNPGKEAFRSNALPALFAWRADNTARAAKLGGWDAVVTTINVLWVPPRAQQETLRLRHPFRNAIEKAIRYAFIVGRDPSWVIEGDTYYDAQTEGSVFIRYAGASKIDLGIFQRHELVVQFDEGKPDVFDALLIPLEITEVLSAVEGTFDDLGDVRGAIELGEDPLTVQSYQFKPTLSSVGPTSGGIAGGTAIALRGMQLSDESTIAIGGVECTDVTYVDETTITALTGAHAAGVADVVLTDPSGATATLTAAFTFA